MMEKQSPEMLVENRYDDKINEALTFALRRKVVFAQLQPTFTFPKKSEPRTGRERMATTSIWGRNDKCEGGERSSYMDENVFRSCK
ncbi:unnamed protein product [Cylicostephanus goldi]|uniref:Uncharacterized protein n=1 Tax=Cylicostephanus goldi TaxID=71465 RepID=A0A3P6RXQ7_CYLGO|nr:unnamed protein product [Cylicostephanus goldi]